MRVRLATQVLSHSVAAAGINTRVLTKELPAEATATALFIEKVDTLFDLLHSRSIKADKPSRYAITVGNKNLSNLLLMKDWVKSWEVKGARSQLSVNCHWGLHSTVVRFQHCHC